VRDDPRWREINKRVLGILMAVIQKDFDPDRVTPKTRLILDLGAEAQEIERIPLEYEKAFGIEITEAEFDRFYETVGGHVDYLCRREDLKI
jgi:acyl carrier protein